MKTRSKLQEQVVDAWLELGQARRAEAVIAGIDGWRSGTAWADHADCLARRGDRAGAEQSLVRARAVADGAKAADDQEWRIDRIRARIAAVEALLAAPKPASAATAATPMTAAEFDAAMAAVDAAVKTGNMDSVRDALTAVAHCFDAEFADAARRDRALQQLRAGRKRVPVDVAVTLSAPLAEIAQRHGSHDLAKELADDAQRIVDEQVWLPEDEIVQRSRLARLRHRIGDHDGASKATAAALTIYERDQARIVDVFRAGALRPLALAYVELGERELALQTFGKVADAGALNPNSRPRAEDLVATCCALVLADFEPDAALRARLQKIAGGLGSPW